MKISNSKKELARIISENGGWRDGEFSVMCRGGEVLNSSNKPFYDTKHGWCCGGGFGYNRFVSDVVAKNWHQTILSRAEYFHLYPAPDNDGWIEWSGGECPVGGGVVVDLKWSDGFERKAAKPEAFRWQHLDSRDNIIAYRLHKPEQQLGELCDKVTDENKHEHVDAKQTIEQLAADYRNLLDFARRKQQEADDAKADADAKLKELELAGEALGLLVSPITANQESELAIEFKVGDEVECVESNIKRDKYNGTVGRLRLIDESDTSTPYLVDFGSDAKIWCHEVKFIRRP